MNEQPASLSAEKLEALWRRVQKPGRYTGGESNQIRKDPAAVKVRVALAFPEVYELGMSYLGQKILYFLLNYFFVQELNHYLLLRHHLHHPQCNI